MIRIVPRYDTKNIIYSSEKIPLEILKELNPGVIEEKRIIVSKIYDIFNKKLPVKNESSIREILLIKEEIISSLTQEEQLTYKVCTEIENNMINLLNGQDIDKLRERFTNLQYDLNIEFGIDDFGEEIEKYEENETIGYLGYLEYLNLKELLDKIYELNIQKDDLLEKNWKIDMILAIDKLIKILLNYQKNILIKKIL